MGERRTFVLEHETPGEIVKRAPDGNFEMLARLRNEMAAYRLVQSQRPDLVPFAVAEGNGIRISRVKIDTPKPTNEVFELIEGLQTVENDGSLPTVSPDLYADIALAKAQQLYLTERASEDFIERVVAYYDEHSPSLGSFDLKFCHGDMQRKNLGRRDRKLVGFDLEQAHFGSELEDFAFFAISSRIPVVSPDKRRVFQYLRAKFASDPQKSANFQEAINLMALDRFLHVLYWNTFQKEPNVSNLAIRWYSKIMIGKILQSDRPSVDTFAMEPSFESDPIKD